MSEIYVSVDCETNGPIPSDYSMLSLGAVAFDDKGNILKKFSVNILPLKGAIEHPDTMTWWLDHKEAYKKATENPLHPDVGMLKFRVWLEQLPGTPVCVCYPAGFDYTFIHWYLVKFAGKDPFGFSCLDMKTYAMRILGFPYRKTIKKNMPKSWFMASHKHNHIAVDDAEEQGYTFMKMFQTP